MSKPKQQSKGFTLIELVIVLAIAALVLAAILLAVGGAQRSQRDTTTKNSAGRLASALQNFASNNGGSFATLPRGTALAASYTTNILDGQGGGPTAPAAYPGIPTAGAGNEITYAGNSVCVSDNGPGGMKAGNTRNYAVVYYTENGGANVCTDNT